MRWTHTPLPADEVGALSRRAGLSPVMAELLLRGGLGDDAKAARFLRPALAELNDPFLLSNLDAAVHYLTLYLPAASQNSLSFGGVRITWKRQVSPPPGTPSFTDVPPGDPAFQSIEALYASGITVGCAGGTTYCPDATLTRRQMAVFLAKALGLHWTDTTP